MSATNIHPIFEKMLARETKEARLNQKAKTLWFTGLSGSGKSTIATGLEKKLFEGGFFIQILDGDNIRSGINNNLSFTEEDRIENIRRISEVSKLFVHAGVITLNSFVSPTKSIRAMAKDIIGSEDFIEIFVNTPLEICEQRDVKGLYKKARAGEIKNFTGIDAPFEAPEQPDVEVKTDGKTIEESVQAVYDQIIEKIKL
ncbi:MAG: adenylyl-sulfate kinase [Saprospiraceae bacterium]|nr:adenylyl-sulfate kinase [Saprospiraceae bacterium]